MRVQDKAVTVSGLIALCPSVQRSAGPSGTSHASNRTNWSELATAEKAVARAGVMAAKRRVSACLCWHVHEDEAGVPSLEWGFDQDVLGAEAKAEGWYALITPLTTAQADPERS